MQRSVLVLNSIRLHRSGGYEHAAVVDELVVIKSSESHFVNHGRHGGYGSTSGKVDARAEILIIAPAQARQNVKHVTFRNDDIHDIKSTSKIHCDFFIELFLTSSEMHVMHVI